MFRFRNRKLDINVTKGYRQSQTDFHYCLSFGFRAQQIDICHLRLGAGTIVVEFQKFGHLFEAELASNLSEPNHMES